MNSYTPWEIEAKWRARWAEAQTYRTPTPKPGQRTFYCLDFFPYPSGAGLSVGHGRNYIPTDVLSRYRRMQGDAVLHPMGWDAFGLPAENEAIKRGSHPAQSTADYAAHYRYQLDLLGCSYDWAREFSSADPAYYRWNQYFFLMLYRQGLAYRAAAPVNWCESCQTVLASEEIEDGRCWRCHQPVVRRTRKQWYIRVTAYAEELYAELEHLDWPEHILAMQRHWIGRSAGVEIQLTVAGHEVPVFTTRPDTLFGVTFIVLAPEHPLVTKVTPPAQQAAVQTYIAQAAQRSDIERHTREPDGVFTGAYATLLPYGARVPVYVADYVLAEHGTGAVMGVPAHDSRDFAFAQRYKLPVVQVIAPADSSERILDDAYTAPGVMVNSQQFDGMASEAAADAIAEWLEDQGLGRKTVHYRLRDWLISRQRYWGTPIPIIHCPHCGKVTVPEAELPVRLPPTPDYAPRGDGKAPLANIAAFVNTPCPQCGQPAKRETDTMTGFVCSSWYYMRFVDPFNEAQPFDAEKAARWLPVDIYVGGAEHAVGHLMYSRFWSKFLADAGKVHFREPFPTLRSQGVLHARDPETGQATRMSKSKGNVVTPESVVERYGADVTRLHLLFMGPFEANVVWEVEADGTTPQHIEGVRRFLHRVWRLGQAETGAGDEGPPAQGKRHAKDRAALERAVHQTIQEVTEQIEILHFNKAISALMTLASALDSYRRRYGDTGTFAQARMTLFKLLAPFAPYITEELWQQLGKSGSIHHQAWPVWDPAVAQAQHVEMAVQIDGRVRERITVDVDADEATVREAALNAPAIQQTLTGPVQKVIVVPGRIVNIVTG